MADEFVDFYEALNLPMEAERTVVRQRINELYLEAQRNLDHRNFQTRVEYQRMFEVVLPRARYILLDDGRRQEYDTLVRAFRAPATPAPAPQAPVKQSFGPGDASSFKLAVEEAAGKAPSVEAVPQPKLDVEQMAQQRDDMWAKWKSGLEAAIARDESEAQAAKSAPAPRPTPAQPTATPSASIPPDGSRKGRPNASAISFNFENGSQPSTEEEEQNARAAAFEIERQRTERKRAVMKEILDNVNVKGLLMGGLGSAVPLGALLVYLMGRYYPRGATPKISLPPNAAWLMGVIVVVGVSYIVALETAKSMRRQAAMKYASLPIEDLLRQLGRSY